MTSVLSVYAAVETATGALVDPRALPFLVLVPLASLGVGVVEAGVSTFSRQTSTALRPTVM